MAGPVRSRALAAAWVCWLATAAALPVWAQNAVELDAQSAAREALRANPDREVALERIEVARGRLQQAGRLDNPELELSGGDDFAFGNEGERSGSLSFEQRFPVTARLEREREIAQGDLDIALAEVREFERTLLSEVLGTFYGVLSLEQRVAVNQELVQSLQSLEAVSERRLRAAEVSRADLNLLRVERRRLAQRGARLGAERDGARLRLLRLLGRPLDSELSVTGELEPTAAADPESYVTAWATRRPDVQAAELGVVRARAEAELSRAQRWEDWRLRVGVDSEREVFDDPRSSEKDAQLGFGLVVPLPLWNRNEGAIAAADAEARRAERARAALVLRAEEEVRAARARVEALRASALEYRRAALPESTQALALLERGYRQGLVGVTELLAAQRQYAEVRDEQLELLVDLRRAQIDLEAASASSPLLAQPQSSGGVTR
jgi:cobalt-zinc-cadmium efflux system outer membrane protein